VREGGDPGQLDLACVLAAGRGGHGDDPQIAVARVEDVAVDGDVADDGMWS
jgi:hypothetical protein